MNLSIEDSYMKCHLILFKAVTEELAVLSRYDYVLYCQFELLAVLLLVTSDCIYTLSHLYMPILLPPFYCNYYSPPLMLNLLIRGAWVLLLLLSVIDALRLSSNKGLKSTKDLRLTMSFLSRLSVYLFSISVVVSLIDLLNFSSMGSFWNRMEVAGYGVTDGKEVAKFLLL